MFLKNYTSDVPVSRTIQRIEEVLIRCGVLGIAKDYAGTNGTILAINFRIRDGEKEFSVRLPADKEKALQALWLDYVDGDALNEKGDQVTWQSKKRKKRADFGQQAERTAWKIIQDWVEVQMSMVQLHQADAVEVFMPYIYDGHQTVYQRIKAGGMRALLPEKCE